MAKLEQSYLMLLKAFFIYRFFVFKLDNEFLKNKLRFTIKDVNVFLSQLNSGFST